MALSRVWTKPDGKNVVAHFPLKDPEKMEEALAKFRELGVFSDDWPYEDMNSVIFSARCAEGEFDFGK